MTPCFCNLATLLLFQFSYQQTGHATIYFRFLQSPTDPIASMGNILVVQTTKKMIALEFIPEKKTFFEDLFLLNKSLLQTKKIKA